VTDEPYVVKLSCNMKEPEKEKNCEAAVKECHAVHKCNSQTFKILFYLLSSFNLLSSPFIFVDGAAQHIKSFPYSSLYKRTLQPETTTIKHQELFSDSECMQRLPRFTKY